MPTVVRVDEAALAEFIRAPDGPIGRHLMVVAEAVKLETVRTLKEGFPRDFLGPTIVKRMSEHDGHPVVQVGTDKVKTRPHRILGNPLLVFFWPKAGATVFTRAVNHPGSDFTKYLTKRLTEALHVVSEVPGGHL